MIESIDDKATGTDLFAEGYFGNNIPTWNSIWDALSSSNGPFVIRQRSFRGGGGYCKYGISYEDLPGEFARAAMKVPTNEIYFNAEIPRNVVTLNCEVTRSHRGLEMYFSRRPENMRTALEIDGAHIHGLRAKLLLESLCCPSGYDSVMDFLDRFDDHVLEITCFARPFGTRGWHTIIWEVRNY